MSEDSNLDNAGQVAAMDELAVVETVVPMSDAGPGQTTIPEKEAKAIAWKEIPTAKDMRAYILAKADILEEIVEVPEWDVKILVRGMNGKERGEVMGGALKQDGKPDLVRMYPAMVIATCYHPTEKVPLFTITDMDDLNKKAGGILERLAMVASRLSGLDVEAAKAIAGN